MKKEIPPFILIQSGNVMSVAKKNDSNYQYDSIFKTELPGNITYAFSETGLFAGLDEVNSTIHYGYISLDGAIENYNKLHSKGTIGDEICVIEDLIIINDNSISLVDLENTFSNTGFQIFDVKQKKFLPPIPFSPTLFGCKISVFEKKLVVVGTLANQDNIRVIALFDFNITSKPILIAKKNFILWVIIFP